MNIHGGIADKDIIKFIKKCEKEVDEEKEKEIKIEINKFKKSEENIYYKEDENKKRIKQKIDE
jgi:hypothetical protein